MRYRLLAICLSTAVLAVCARPALAKNDIVQFGDGIHISHGETVHDTVCFFCSVEDEGTVNGDIVVFFGNVHITGQANHDVVNFFGRVTAEPDASIGQDLVNFFGGVRLGERVSVGKDVVSMFGPSHIASTVSIGGDRVVQPPWLFWGPLIVLFLIVYTIVHEIRGHRRRMYLRGYPFPPPPPPPTPPPAQ